MRRAVVGSSTILLAILLSASPSPAVSRVAAPPTVGTSVAPATITPPPTITAIAAGAWHTCALTAGGGVVCWGGNYFGELGNGSTGFSPVPVAVTGLSAGATAIAAGSHHTCALLRGDGVTCWGQNTYGQLGSGTTTGSGVPVPVQGVPSGVTAIAASGDHTCARTSGGSALCWGANYVGQTGNGVEWRSLVPVDVTGRTGGFTADSGNNHTCALASGGGATCWGYNNVGQLGNGITNTSHSASFVPVEVVGLGRGVSAISTGANHTCAITDGRVVCWGYNLHGELGNRTRVNSNAPVDVSGLATGVSAAAAGSGHTCAVTSSGGVRCWGANYSGQLGNGGRTNSPAAVAVSGLASGIEAIASGSDHTCALASRGRVRCWGQNAYGQLGDGTTVGRRVPVDVRFLVFPTIGLRSSSPVGTIDQGTTVTFDATVRPLAPAGSRPVVRFAVFRWEAGAWRTAATRDVMVGATGNASLRWGFVTAGQRAVRAKVLSNATFAGSPWTPPLRYTVP
jgi:alpha-tubulin suppressor-like RCC1 family protein